MKSDIKKNIGVNNIFKSVECYILLTQRTSYFLIVLEYYLIVMNDVDVTIHLPTSEIYFNKTTYFFFAKIFQSEEECIYALNVGLEKD